MTAKFNKNEINIDMNSYKSRKMDSDNCNSILYSVYMQS